MAVSPPNAPSTAWLETLNIRSVLDIGANTGQFASRIRVLFPSASVYSFEPLPLCFEQLQTNLAGTPNFIAFNVALSDENGILPFERNTFSPSSSFLRMAALHRDAFPYTRDTDIIRVTARRLDDLSTDLDLRDPLLAKIDVQGYEDHVLRGGENTFRHARAIIIETSFEALYEGQPLFDDIYVKLVSWGFRYSGALEQLCSPLDGRPLQEDSVFLKRS